MNYYLNYLNNVAMTPNQQYRSDTEAFIKSQWKDTTLLKTVQEETAIGSNVYSPFEVWKNTVSDFDINVLKNAKDFRRLMFQEVEHIAERGLMYQFDNNYWICYEPTNEEEPYPEILVRRCNNIAKWVDTDNGKVIELPCILDYTISATTPQKDKDVIVANSSVTLIIQGNELTHKLEKNQRFIFNGVPFKFVAYNNYMQNSYITNEVPLLFMDCDLDIIQSDDDMQNNIANRYSYNYSINIIQDNSQQVNGFSGKIDTEIKLNDNVVDRNVVFEGNEYVLVGQNGDYILNGTVGNVAKIKAYIAGNPDIYDTVDIEIVANVMDKYELIIDPLYTKINQNRTNTFTVTLYKNSIAQSDIVTYVTSGVDNSYYSLTQDGNNFTLIGLKMSTTPLTITFTSGTITKSTDIQLKSAF